MGKSSTTAIQTSQTTPINSPSRPPTPSPPPALPPPPPHPHPPLPLPRLPLLPLAHRALRRRLGRVVEVRVRQAVERAAQVEARELVRAVRVERRVLLVRLAAV